MIFCISFEVICFSWRCSHELVHLSSGGLLGGPSSSEDAESQLEDKSGTESSWAVVASDVAHRDVLSRAFLQQNVSRFQRRQLRFSNRLPSSIACDVLEKSDHCTRHMLAFTVTFRGHASGVRRKRATYHSKEVLHTVSLDGIAETR